MLEKPFFTSKFSHEGMIKHLDEHIRKTIYTFFSLKFIPRNIKRLFWIEQSSFREKYFQQKEQPEKNPTESRNNLDIWERTSSCFELRMGVDEETVENRGQYYFSGAVCKVLGVWILLLNMEEEKHLRLLSRAVTQSPQIEDGSLAFKPKIKITAFTAIFQARTKIALVTKGRIRSSIWCLVMEFTSRLQHSGSPLCLWTQWLSRWSHFK